LASFVGKSEIEIYEKIKQFATSYKLEEKVQMKLFPEELGNLDVELKKEGKQIQILFLAENEKVKDTIEKNSYILRERLASLDFEVRTFEVKVREEERYYDQKQGQEEGKIRTVRMVVTLEMEEVIKKLKKTIKTTIESG